MKVWNAVVDEYIENVLEMTANIIWIFLKGRKWMAFRDNPKIALEL